MWGWLWHIFPMQGGVHEGDDSGLCFGPEETTWIWTIYWDNQWIGFAQKLFPEKLFEWIRTTNCNNGQFKFGMSHSIQTVQILDSIGSNWNFLLTSKDFYFFIYNMCRFPSKTFKHYLLYISKYFFFLKLWHHSSTCSHVIW